MDALYGGIEAGGTKFVCGVGTGPDDLRDEIRIPTTTPAETLSRAIEFFRAKARRHPLTALGIASFGPVDLNPQSATFGSITYTPKPGWSNVHMVRIFRDALTLDHPAWKLEAHYLAIALVNFICTLSPQKIVMGGGVMEQRQLFPLIRQDVRKLLNGYVQAAEVLEGIDEYIVPPELGNRAGVLGAIALARQSAVEN
jgi:predicted NBD/HSP70 family sugar kinase